MKGNFISKNDSYVIKAIAVMLMVFHHLFGFPERIQYEYRMIFDFSFFHFETILSYFGRICISIFAFLSGYAMAKALANKSDMQQNFVEGCRVSWKSLKGFYMRFWLVCAVFFLYGILTDVIRPEPYRLFKNILGIACSYNAEWWYVQYYVLFLVLFPFIYWITQKINSRIYTLMICISAAAFLGVICVQELEMLSVPLYLLCFVLGMYTLQLNIYENIYEGFQTLFSSPRLQFMSGVGILWIVFCARTWLVGEAVFDFILAPIFVFGIVVILRTNLISPKIVDRIAFVGKYSTYIWLTHTFFAYYFWQKELYYFRYSIFIFIVCMLMSLASGIMFERIKNYLIR